MRKLMGLAFLLAFIFIILVPCARATHNPMVEIYDATFTTETDYFSTCPVTVGIKTYSNTGPYNVILVKPDTTEITLATGVAAGVWHSFTYTCDQTGWWQAKAGLVTIPFGIGTFFVIPEVPLGVATTLTACFAGVGFNELRRARKEKRG